MLIKRPDDVRSSEITPQSSYRNRRQFLRDSGALGLGTIVAGAAPGLLLPRTTEAAQKLPGIIKSPLSTDESQTDYEDATRYNNFYEFSTSKEGPAKYAGDFKPRPWSVTVDGHCAKPGTVDLEDFIAPHKLEERIYRLRCVEAWSMVIPWVGFPLGDLLKRFEPDSRAKYVEFTTLLDRERMPGQKRKVLQWPYREGLRMDEAMHPLSILVVGMYGELLPNQNGAPLRLMVPWKYGFKAIKSIVRIRFTDTQPRNTWNLQAPREYGFYANVNPAVDHPRWTQKKERRIGDWFKRKTEPFNGYGEQVAGLYSGMDLNKHF